MVNYEKKTNIICVNSIKGGAGKTTISLSLACTALGDLEAKYNSMIIKNDKIQEPKVCYIDLDILGTGAKHIIYGENYIEDKINYFNNIKGKDVDYKQYINEFKMEGLQFKIDCIIMNDEPEEKNKFINNVRTHTSSVNINVFENKAKSLIKSIVRDNIYDYIIIDCAPSYESFSRNIYDYIIKEIDQKTNNVANVYNLFVSTLDKSHVMNTISFMHNIIDSSEHTNVKIVLNDTLNHFKTHEVKDKFVSCMLEKFLEIRKKKISSCGDLHQPSKTKFNTDSIIVKKYSKIADNMFFGNGKQLNGTKLWNEIEDRELVGGLKIL